MGDAGGEGPHGRIVRALPAGDDPGNNTAGVEGERVEFELHGFGEGNVSASSIAPSTPFPPNPLISRPAPLHPHYSLLHLSSDLSFTRLFVLPAILVSIQILPLFANRLRPRKQEPKTAYRTTGEWQG